MRVFSSGRLHLDFLFSLNFLALMKVCIGLVVTVFGVPAPVIIGGKNASDGQFPHQVTLKKRIRFALLWRFYYQDQQGKIDCLVIDRPAYRLWMKIIV